VAYELRIHREAQKELLELPNEVHNRVYQQLLELQREPRPRQAVKLKGREDLWQLRVSKYRVIYHVNSPQQVVTVLKVTLRNERTYRNL
jgi:mRNA interferase RelE/StbE